MKRLLTVLAAVALLQGCDGGDVSTAPTAPGAETPAEGSAPAEGALHLRPRLQLVGIGDVHQALSVSRLAFDAELVVLSDEAGGTNAGDALDVRFSFDRGRASTIFTDDDRLSLARAGRYSLFIRVRPDGDDAASVTVGGALAAPEEPADGPRHKADEPAPIPAEPAPIPAEPAPIPADQGGSPADEPAPIPADQGGSPADEPAPIPADQGDEEPAPIPADEGAEEPAPIPARQKADTEMPGVGEAAFEPLYVRSSRAFNFYAGTVEVQPGDSELVVTWDVRTWLRSVLADQLGTQPDEVQETQQQPGFSDVPSDFRLDAH